MTHRKSYHFFAQYDINAQNGTDSSFRLQNIRRWIVCQILALVPNVVDDFVKHTVLLGFRFSVQKMLFAGFLNWRFGSAVSLLWVSATADQLHPRHERLLPPGPHFSSRVARSY